MSDIWFTSDQHFQHYNMCMVFTDSEGKRIRNFSSVEEMDEIMIQKWNSVVKPNDTLYHGGDVYFSNPVTADKLLHRLNGNKQLILGNHDKINHQSILLKHFSKIILWKKFDNFIMTHIPITKNQFPFKAKANIHGHIHQQLMKDQEYINICVEHTNYTPIALETIEKEIDKRGLL